ncbi:MAG: OadG family protein [Clostridia bacterium]|nr:OadG family protein [Clostridia bacterium]
MLNMISLLTANGMPMADRLAYSLRMLIVGLGMVFVVLAILWGVLVLSRILLHDMPNRRREEEKGESQKAVATAPAAPAPTPAPVVVPAPAQTDAALIAVITAAISAAMAEEGSAPAGGFRVVSFRRVSGNSAWNRK